MTKTLEELSVMAEKEKAVQACKNLMAYYLDLAVCWHNKEYMGFWADREEIAARYGLATAFRQFLEEGKP